MNLSLRFEKKNFHYTSPVTVGTKKVAKNTALRITFPDGHLLDLAPLPFFHQHDISHWQFAIETTLEKLVLDLAKIDFKKPLFGLGPFSHKDLELLYAVEAVLFSFLENSHPHLIPQTGPVKINGLFSEKIPFKSTPECVKIKIRPGEESSCIRAIQECQKERPDVLIRLDGNRTFELESLLHFMSTLAEGLQSVSLQYLEEPFKNFFDLYGFRKISSVPIALDESLLYHLEDLDQLKEELKEEFFILKPTLLGLSTCFALIEHFPGRTIISSTYEFPEAMKALYALAALNPEQYHGLDTEKFLPKEFSY